MEAKKYQHHIEGMHEYNGVLYLPSTPPEHLEKIRNFEFNEGDVLVDTFSKSGTTWTQEIVYLIHNGVNIEEASQKPIKQRVPFIDFNRMWPRVTEMKHPRILKSHLRPEYFQGQIEKGHLKIIVTMRNPKDTLVSFYHFYQTNIAFGGFSGSWAQFFDLVMKDELIYGDWFEFTLAWWRMKGHQNVLILKYEDMKKDPRGNIQEIADFCKKDLTKDQLDRIVDHTSFEKMQANSSVNYANESFMKNGQTFMRKGSIGNWKDYFTVAQSNWFDAVFEEKCKKEGIDFTFEA